jgi:hypothetical protein
VAISERTTKGQWLKRAEAAEEATRESDETTQDPGSREKKTI